MGFKENMMKGMMGNMSAEKKKEMMNSMMDQFFGSMTPEEKKELMTAMMPKMMQQMMGGGGMMAMMSGMMGKKSGEDSSGTEGQGSMDMCREMMTSLRDSRQTAMIATPELQGLFKEWIQQLEEEILTILAGKKSLDTAAIAQELRLSEQSVSYLIARLGAEKKVRVKVDVL